MTTTLGHVLGETLGPAVVVPLHGVGGARDLPIPAGLAIIAAMVALVVSFVVLIFAWRSPRYDAATQGRPLPAAAGRLVDSPGLRWTLRGLGLLGAAYLAWALLAGPDLVTNPVFGVFYVLLWVGIVPASLLLGPAYRLVSPVRTLHLLLSLARGTSPSQGLLRYPRLLGYWPASIGLFAFVWQELANPRSTLIASVQIWLALYVALMLIGAILFGDVFLARADPFEVYSTLVGRLCPLGRRGDGVLVLRSPLSGLDGVPVEPGLVAVLSVLFGSTAFDSYKDRLTYSDFVDSLTLPSSLTNVLALLVFCAVIALSFSFAAMLTVRDPTGSSRRALPGRLVHSLVPIVVGYMTAHYLSYFVEQGQTTMIQLSDPMVDGSNLLGTADLSVSYWLSQHPSFLADVKVLAIVLGHVTGAIAAHDRTLRLLPKRHQITGQLPMLVLMVAYTGAGLYLLFGA